MDTPTPTTPPALPVASPQVIEQYKAKLTDLSNLGARQTAMTAYYVSIITALFGVLALKEKAITHIDTLVLCMVCGAGFAICLLWFSSLTFFRAVFRSKMQMLEEMEKSLPFQTFRTEFESRRGAVSPSWLQIERLVPAVFALFFLGLVVARLYTQI